MPPASLLPGQSCMAISNAVLRCRITDRSLCSVLSQLRATGGTCFRNIGIILEAQAREFLSISEIDGRSLESCLTLVGLASEL